MFIDHHFQQIVRWKTRNLELCSGTNVGNNNEKIEKISISQAIQLGNLRSLVRAIRFEANKSNRRRKERPIGSHTVKMLRDLLLRARSCAACDCCERARQSESKYAQLVDMMSRIVAHNRLRDGSNATCARGSDRADLNVWRGKSRSFSLFSSVSRVR